MFFVCLSFFGFTRFAESKGEQHNAYNNKQCFWFLHDGFDYNHSVHNSVSIENSRHQVHRLSKTYQILHFQHCSVYFLSVIALLFWSCKKVFKPQNHKCLRWFIASFKKSNSKNYWILNSKLYIQDSFSVQLGLQIPILLGFGIP